MQTGLRATLIHPDGTDERRVNGVQMSYLDAQQSLPKVIVPDGDVPDWAGQDTEVVVARDDGSVEAAFTANFIGVVDLDHVSGTGWPDDDTGIVWTFSPRS